MIAPRASLLIALCLLICPLVTQTISRTKTYKPITRAKPQQPAEEKTNKPETQKPAKPKMTLQEEDDAEVALVLTNFAQIVNHFINIVQNPKSTQNVAQSVGGIICNIGTVIAQAIKKRVITFESEETAAAYETMMTEKIEALRTQLDCAS